MSLAKGARPELELHQDCARQLNFPASTILVSVSPPGTFFPVSFIARRLPGHQFVVVQRRRPLGRVGPRLAALAVDFRRSCSGIRMVRVCCRMRRGTRYCGIPAAEGAPSSRTPLRPRAASAAIAAAAAME